MHIKPWIAVVLIVWLAACTQAAPKEVTTPSGLKYTDLVVGTGAQPKPGQTVIVHYTGWLTDGKNSIARRTATSRSRSCWAGSR